MAILVGTQPASHASYACQRDACPSCFEEQLEFERDLRAEVASSAALLDRVRPGWWQAVDVARLDFADDQQCVLGQLFGDFDEACHELNLHEDDPGVGGFFGHSSYISNLDPRDLWAEAIGVRRFHEFRDQLPLFPAVARTA